MTSAGEKITALETRVAHLDELLEQQNVINHQMVELVTSLRELTATNQEQIKVLLTLVSANGIALQHIENTDTENDH